MSWKMIIRLATQSNDVDDPTGTLRRTKMLVLKERVVSGLEVKKSTIIKSTRTELLGQFLLDSHKPSIREQKKKDTAQEKKNN